MESHADDSPGWSGKFNFGKIGNRRAAIEPQASRPQSEIKSRFSLVWAHDIGDEDNHKEWIIRDIFGAGEFSYIVGQPGAGKSMCATDMACHVAAGWDWHGFKVKKPGFVLYIAAERAKLTRRRIKAWRKKHRFNDDLPVLVVSGYMNLTDGLEDAKELISVIGQAEDECGMVCRLIIIDTLTRVFGGGDQNASKDMTRLIDAVSMIHEAVPEAHVCVIHHTTHAGTRAKGAIDLDGAVDVSFMVGPKGGVVVLENTGANDGKEGDLLAYEFESITLGKDDEGEWTTAPVLVPVNIPESGVKSAPPMAKSQRDLLDIARSLMGDNGEPVPGQLVREAYYSKYPSKDRETLKKAYARAIKALNDRQLLDSSDGFIVITGGH
jgi:hypothetical protein